MKRDFDAGALKLPIRLAADQDESTVGFALRLAEANGYPGLRWFFASAADYELVSEAERRTRPWSGLDTTCQTAFMEKAIRQATLGEYRRASPESEVTDSCVVPIQVDSYSFLDIKYFDFASAKVCPICLRERPRLLAAWDLTYWLVCPRHKCLMLHRCRNCGRPLHWRRTQINRCCGGTTFAEMETEEADRETLDLMYLIGSKCTKSETPYGSVLEATFGSMAAVDVFEFILLVAEMSEKMSHNSGARHETMPFNLRRRHLRTAAIAFHDWPRTFHLLFGAIYRSARRRTIRKSDASNPFTKILVLLRRQGGLPVTDDPSRVGALWKRKWLTLASW